MEKRLYKEPSEMRYKILEYLLYYALLIEYYDIYYAV